MTVPAPKGFDLITVKRSDGEERVYASQLLPADLGFETAAKVGAVLAGPLGAVLSGALGLRAEKREAPAEGEAQPGIAGGFLAADVSPEVLSSALTTLGVSLRDASVAEVLAVMMPRIERWDSPDGKGGRERQKIVWAQEFAGEYGALLEVLIGTLKHNFRSFFSTGPAAGLLSAGRNLGLSSLQRASTTASSRSPVAMARTP